MGHFNMRVIDAKRIIQPSGNFNLYRGCTHGCIYCDARSACYQIKDFERVTVKKDAVLKVHEDLSKKRQKAMLRTGGMSDPYVTIEKHTEIFKGILDEVYASGFGIEVLTKSDLALRDIDVYKKINKRYRTVMAFTLTTVDDELARIIEPNVSLPSQRLKALKQFHDAGIMTGVWLTPVIPFITDSVENIETIIKACHDAGVSYIMNFGMSVTMREGNRDYFYKQLDRYFPGMKTKYIQTFGQRYICNSPKQNALQAIFEKRCNAYGIIFNHDEIHALIHKEKETQLTLF
jgi:DNA repair photolyase